MTFLRITITGWIECEEVLLIVEYCIIDGDKYLFLIQ
jgi:hypothetical protein